MSVLQPKASSKSRVWKIVLLVLLSALVMTSVLFFIMMSLITDKDAITENPDVTLGKDLSSELFKARTQKGANGQQEKKKAEIQPPTKPALKAAEKKPVDAAKGAPDAVTSEPPPPKALVNPDTHIKSELAVASRPDAPENENPQEKPEPPKTLSQQIKPLKALKPVLAALQQPDIKIEKPVLHKQETLQAVKLKKSSAEHELKQGKTGFVVVEFTVTADGDVNDAVVIEAEPAGVNDQAALEAARKLRFDPHYDKGASVIVENAKNKFIFLVEDDKQ